MVSLVIGLAASMIVCSPSAMAESHPNIVFFLIDDLGYADCGFNGGSEIRTPQIDRLAQSGAVIESHYVQPVCSPTRAALMTGRYATRTGVYTIVTPHAKWGLPLNERTLASALKDAGYETAITGKWHLGEFDPAYVPTARGFDHQYGHYFGALDYFTHMRDQSHDWYRDGKELKEQGYTTHLLAKEACRLISERNKAKPLFLYVPFNGVHSPFQVPEKYIEPYGHLQGNRRTLAGMLAAVDEAIGQIVSALDTAGIRDNTLVIFSSDNGGPRPGVNTPLRDYKASIYEGGVRAAAFAAWPGKIPSGVRIRQPMHIIDWYPTLIKLAGGSLNQTNPIDGSDIWPMLTQGAPSPHDAILSVQSPERAAIRMGDWKLIMNPNESSAAKQVTGNGKGKAKKARQSKSQEPTDKKKSSGPQYVLYNLASDPSEAKDLAAVETTQLAIMKQQLLKMMKGAVPPGSKQ